jgi:hypothetical protein
VLGLPFCFTEVDVSSANEHMRADDLEEGLREAQAHPAVYVVVLWGFCDNAQPLVLSWPANKLAR